MKKLKTGMIGVAGFGSARRNLMRKTGLFDLVAGYDIREQACKQFAEAEDAEVADSYEALLEVPGLDVMVISTGAKFHAEQTLAALDKGLHVFVEKPLCSTPEEMHALIEAQKRTGLVVGVGHTDHSSCAVSLRFKEMIDSGALGTIATFEKTTAHSGGLKQKADEWRSDPKKNPGGMLFQCGVHGLHELMFYFGPIKSVSARMRYDVHTTPTADTAHCHLAFESGLIGSLNAYHVTPYRHTFSIFGTRTNLYREDTYTEEGTLIYTQTTHMDGEPEPKVPLQIEDAQSSKANTGNLESFYKAVTGKGTPYPSLIDGARAVNAVFAAETSAKTGKPVEIPQL